MSNRAVSVLMPAHNAAATVEASCRSILDQKGVDLELIVIDDGSTDETAIKVAQLRDNRLKLMRVAKNIGLVRALNLGLTHCSRDLVARQDADDIAMPGRLDAQVTQLERSPQCVAIGCALTTFDDDNHSRGTWSYPASTEFARWQALFKTPVAHSAVVFRRDAVLQAGGYREEFIYAEDFDLWSRLLSVGEIVSLSAPLLRYRLGASGISRSKRHLQEAAHLRVSRRNMEAHLGESVEHSACEILSLRLDQGPLSLAASEFEGAMRLLACLLKAGPLHGTVGKPVNNDAMRRLTQLLRSRPRSTRAQCAKLAKSMGLPLKLSQFLRAVFR